LSPDLEPSPEPKQVLLVEDDVLIRVLLAEELRGRGLRVIEPANADEALSYFQAAARVDLLFADIEVPGSLNGAELARRIRSSHPGLPIVLTSGGARRAVDEPGVFLPKPYAFERAVMVVFEKLGLEPPAAP
jgi:CheY-like chemotaxis protein